MMDEDRWTEVHARIAGLETAFVLLVRALEDGCCISASGLAEWIGKAERDARQLNAMDGYVRELRSLREQIAAATAATGPTPVD